jgi:DNA sulfur modification protein DndC
MDKFKKIIQNIQKVYLSENKPFVIGYSGGKDSTVTLQLVWEALSQLSPKELNNKIFVISVDTMVETPYIQSYINETVNSININGGKSTLPIQAMKLTPRISQSFWVNLIGKGYPAPSQTFRWCTQRLKINPVDYFIQDKVSESGEVIVVLGARSSESSSRSQVFSNKEEEKQKHPNRLSLHPSLEGAYVYTPIEDLSADDVWQYLYSNTSTPWQSNNRDLAAIYQNASGGECPMVIDTSTPSCGNSRFGCWVCTLVGTDTSMENLIDGGEEWMLPLIEMRDFLRTSLFPENKAKFREYKRRNGKVYYVKDTNRIAYGPYKFEWKKKFLKMLLNAQKSVQQNGPDQLYQLISLEELKLIRKIWKEEEHDWVDSVPKIYEEVIGNNFPQDFEDGIHFNTSDFALLEDICKKENLPSDLVARLIDEERKLHGMSKRSGILTKLDRVLNEEWRSEEQVIAEDIGMLNEN